MADGWGEARPEEYIDTQGAPVAPGLPSAGWADANVGYVQEPQVPELLMPNPSPAQMGRGSGKQMGTVKTWINDKGFGFITKHDGSDVFVHHSAVYAQGKASLEVGESVEFNLIISNDGRSKAENVTGPGGVHVKGCSTLFGSSAGGMPCRNFQNSGECRFGVNCRFMHGSVGGSGGNASYSYGGSPNGYGSPYSGGRGTGYSNVGGSYGRGGGSGFGASGKKPCFNFQNNGHCKFGERCRFGHE